jgi:hypothetical protein
MRSDAAISMFYWNNGSNMRLDMRWGASHNEKSPNDRAPQDHRPARVIGGGVAAFAGRT